MAPIETHQLRQERYDLLKENRQLLERMYHHRLSNKFLRSLNLFMRMMLEYKGDR